MPDAPHITRLPSVSVTWAANAVWLTALVGAAAKVLGVMIAPGLRGIASARAVERVELAAGAFGYVFAALLVALVCAGSFELARARHVGVLQRGLVVALSGLTVALASPALVMRLHTVAALGLAVVASVVAVVAGSGASRAPRTRALGAVFVLFATAALLRAVGWESAAIGGERASLSLFELGRGLVTGAVVLEGIAVLVAAAWIGIAGGLRGRLLANLALLAGVVVTWLAARGGGPAASSLELMLRGAVLPLVSMPALYALTPVAAFLVSASLLLALAALAVRAARTSSGSFTALVPASFALALLSRGAFDVPLQALAAIAGALWAVLAMDERARAPDHPPAA